MCQRRRGGPRSSFSKTRIVKTDLDGQVLWEVRVMSHRGTGGGGERQSREGCETTSKNPLINPRGPNKTPPIATWRFPGTTGLAFQQWGRHREPRRDGRTKACGIWGFVPAPECPRKSLATSLLSLWLSCLVGKFC